MRLSLFPTYSCKSTYDIPFEKLYAQGVRGAIFDVDNTLVRHNAPADGRAKLLFTKLKRMGMAVCIISNNKEPRVKPFADEVDSSYVFDAGKPLPRGYLEAVQRMNISNGQAVFVGDQIYTDILGANLAGIKSILVKPLGPEIEIQIKIKRILEIPVLAAYRMFCRSREI